MLACEWQLKCEVVVVQATGGFGNLESEDGGKDLNSGAVLQVVRAGQGKAGPDVHICSALTLSRGGIAGPPYDNPAQRATRRQSFCAVLTSETIRRHRGVVKWEQTTGKVARGRRWCRNRCVRQKCTTAQNRPKECQTARYTA
jgi:hypothetical protein